MSLVSLVGVDKSYGTWPVLQRVDIVVPDGREDLSTRGNRIGGPGSGVGVGQEV